MLAVFYCHNYKLFRKTFQNHLHMFRCRATITVASNYSDTRKGGKHGKTGTEECEGTQGDG